MPYLLDTDVIIDYLKGYKYVPENVLNNSYISIITYAELEYGFRKAKVRSEILKDFLQSYNISIINVNASIASIYVDLRIKLEGKGQKLADFDLLIAATAIASNLKLVTRNTKHFARIKGLKLYSKC